MGSVSAAWTAPPGPARPSAQTGGAPGFTGPASDSNAPGAGRTPLLAGVAFVRLQLAPGLCGNRCTVLLRQLPWRITIRSHRTPFFTPTTCHIKLPLLLVPIPKQD